MEVVVACVQSADKRQLYAALTWNPSGEMSVRKPRETWKRIIER